MRRKPPARWLRIKNDEPLPAPWRPPRRLGPSKRYRRKLFTLFEIETFGLTNVRCKPQPIQLTKMSLRFKPRPDFMSTKDRKPRPGVKYIKSKNNPVLVCECGNRYLKTREGQERCLYCIAYGVDSSALRRGAMVQ